MAKVPENLGDYPFTKLYQKTRETVPFRSPYPRSVAECGSRICRMGSMLGTRSGRCPPSRPPWSGTWSSRAPAHGSPWSRSVLERERAKAAVKLLIIAGLLTAVKLLPDVLLLTAVKLLIAVASYCPVDSRLAVASYCTVLSCWQLSAFVSYWTVESCKLSGCWQLSAVASFWSVDSCQALVSCFPVDTLVSCCQLSSCWQLSAVGLLTAVRC